MPTRKRIKHGGTPYPEHVAPSPDDCQKVCELLTAFHGPACDGILKPSVTDAGCGRVDDVLDALCRTIISGATQMARADAAVRNLVAEFGLHKGTVNWLALMEAPPEKIHAAIKGCGLGNKKTEFVKALCAKVRADNAARLAVLRADKNAGIPSPPPSPLDEAAAVEEKRSSFSPWMPSQPSSPVTSASSGLTAAAAEAAARPADANSSVYSEEDRDAEIAELSNNILSLQHLKRPEVTVAEALRKLSAFQGVSVKTAACIVLFCLRKPCLAVDSHVWRLTRWLGWVPDRANDQSTFYHLEVRVPDQLKYDLHQLLVFHGQSCFRCSAGNKDRSEGNGARWEGCVCPLEDLLDRQKGDTAPTKEKADAGAGSPLDSTCPAATTAPSTTVSTPPYPAGLSVAVSRGPRVPECPATARQSSPDCTNVISETIESMNEHILEALPLPTPPVPTWTDSGKLEENEEEKNGADTGTQDVTMEDACQYNSPITESRPDEHRNTVTAQHLIDPHTDESGAEWRIVVEAAMAPYRRAELDASVQLLPEFRQLDEMIMEDTKGDLEIINNFYDSLGRQSSQ